MGLFGCSHHWKKIGRRKEGRRQYHCTKCGRLKWKSEFVFTCAVMGWHNYRLDRRRRNRTLVCKKCGDMMPTA